MADYVYYSRWKTLCVTSPSGKTMFVCTVCGRTSYTPDKECPPIELGVGLGQRGTKPDMAPICKATEDRVNETVQKADDWRCYLHAELQLVGVQCRECHDLGCPHCVGRVPMVWPARLDWDKNGRGI